jgi:hypothetical protein
MAQSLKRAMLAVLAWPLLCASGFAAGPGIKADAFEADPQAAVQATAVTSISPTMAPAPPANGLGLPTQVTLSGTFQSGASVQVGAASATILSASATQIKVSVAAQPAGTVDVTVTNLDGTKVVLAKAFTFTTGPIIYQLSPNMGPAATSTVVTVSGANLERDSTITIAQKPTSVQFYFSRGLLTMEVPANPADPQGAPVSGDVKITNPDGQSLTLPKAFTWTQNSGSSGGRAVSSAGRCQALSPGQALGC